MKIAYYSSSREDIPHDPKSVAANSDVMLNIINKLKFDNEIFLYASTGSKVEGVEIVNLGLAAHQLDSAYIKEDWVKNVYTAYILRYLTEMAHRSEEYDLIHLNVGKLYMGMPFARVCKCPVVITIHQQLDEHEEEILKSFPDAYLVSISDSQRKKIPSLNYFATVYNGTDADEFKFDPQGGGSYTFRSRVSPEKGVEFAIDAVSQVGGKLNIFGPGDEKYLNDSVKPHLNDDIKYLGMIGNGEEMWLESYQKAKALILPIQWDEPFGLVMTEAMACGTPVIAFSRGSVPEVIVDGKTGFIVNGADDDIRGDFIVKKTGVEGLVEAIKLIEEMPREKYLEMRQNSRKHVEDNFTVTKMADEYMKVYKRAIAEFKG